MRQQYGLRINSEEFRSMPWDEFADLVAGLNEQTPLVRVAQIRTENDAERVRAMTADQRRMRMEWQRMRAPSRADTESFLKSIQQAFAKTFGEG